MLLPHRRGRGGTGIRSRLKICFPSGLRVRVPPPSPDAPALSGEKLRAICLWLIVAGLAIVGAVFGLKPDLDLRIAAYFFDPATHSFSWAEHPVILSLRNLNSAIDIIFGVVLAMAVLLAYLVPSRPPIMSRRTVIFLAVTFALAPGLFANAIFKEHWSRPRPYSVTEFGATAPFVPWWDPRGTCKRNCSFFSGEVSAAAWTIAPAVLVPGAAGVVAIVAAFAFTAAIAVVRMAQGGHFFSDVAFAALITWLIVWIAYGFYDARPRANRQKPW
jgi:lipid A 4'-phosphatase